VAADHPGHDRPAVHSDPDRQVETLVRANTTMLATEAT
jgi:hypothetical protein